MSGTSKRKLRETTDRGISAPGPDRRTPLVIAIAGGSGSGKTWLADRLQAVLGRIVLRISLDSFYRDRSRVPEASRARINFDHPRAIDWAAVELALRTLLKGRRAEIPTYDFKTHSRLPGESDVAASSSHPARGPLAIKEEKHSTPGVLRDFSALSPEGPTGSSPGEGPGLSGRTIASVRRQFRACVEPMHRRFVEPQVKIADLVLRENCGATEVARLASEIRRLLGKP